MAAVVQDIASVAELVNRQMLKTRETLLPGVLRIDQQLSELAKLKTSTRAAALEEITRNVQPFLDECNAVVRVHLKAFEGVSAALQAVMPAGAALLRNTGPLSTAQFKEKQFVVSTNSEEFSLGYLCDESLDGRVETVRARVQLIQEQLRDARISVFTPLIMNGSTVEHESRREMKPLPKIVTDSRKEAVPDGSVQLIKALFGDQFGTLELLPIEAELRREPKSVLVNPHACYSDGHHHYTEIEKAHSYCWRLRFPLGEPGVSDYLIGKFSIENTLHPDFQI